MDTETSS